MSQSLDPSLQAREIYRHVCAQSYDPKRRPPPEWRTIDDLVEPGNAHRLRRMFDIRSDTWRADPKPKLQHTRGAVALFRLEMLARSELRTNKVPDASIAALGDVFHPGTTRWLVGRYSRAAGPKIDQPPMGGIALKIPRYDRNPIDVSMLSEYGVTERLSEVWSGDFKTRIRNPLDNQEKPADPRRQELIEFVGSFQRTIRELDLSAGGVTPVELPVPKPLGVHLVSWRHSHAAVQKLAACGDKLFGDERATMAPKGRPLVDGMGSQAWAELRLGVDPKTPSFVAGLVYLETRFHFGPVGDLWLHFSHHRG